MVKGWIDRALDHQMILRRDDPLVGPLQALGEPIYLVDSNPTVELIAQLIYDVLPIPGLRRRRGPGLGNANLLRDVRRPVTFRLVVFDLDGTLIDSIGDLSLAVNRLVAELGGRALALEDVSRMVGEGAALLVQRALQAAGLDSDPAAALRRFLEIYDAILPGTTRPYPGMIEALTALAPRATLAVLTNKPAAATVKLLEAFDLARFFSFVVGGDGPFRRKPDPQGLCHLLEAAGVAAGEAVLVGDSMVDLQAARAGGVAACIARYGFGYAVFSASALRGDELLADSPADLPRLLAGGA